jgi:hypothetical protein
MLIFLGCCAVPQAPARSFGCISATTQHSLLSERHSAVTFLLNCVSLPAQEHGHHTPNSITAHPFHELKIIFIKQISSPLLCQIAHRRWGGSGPKEGPDDREEHRDQELGTWSWGLLSCSVWNSAADMNLAQSLPYRFSGRTSRDVSE